MDSESDSAETAENFQDSGKRVSFRVADDSSTSPKGM